MKKIIQSLFILFIVSSCKKSDFLNAKPDDKLTIPTTLEHFQAILDNFRLMNGGEGAMGGTPAFGRAGDDDYYVSDTYLNILNQFDRNLYTWATDLYIDNKIADWINPYSAIFSSNVVLDGLQNLNNLTDSESYKNVKGSALFYRAYMYHQLSQIFSPVYNKATASTELGLPLRLTSDINESIFRSSLQQTYDRIVFDLQQSVKLLPEVPLYKTRPSRPAAYAMLARVFLSMSDYPRAWLYADTCLKLKNSLLDYNTISPGNSYPFPPLNDEVFFHSSFTILSTSLTSSFFPSVDSVLFHSYDEDDLRKTLFFQNPGINGEGVSFRGTYGNISNGIGFSGLATDEILLIRAECNARAGDITAAMDDLNQLLRKRWKSGTFKQKTASDANDALNNILSERRKELLSADSDGLT